MTQRHWTRAVAPAMLRQEWSTHAACEIVCMPPLPAVRCGARILRRRFAHDRLEVADEVRLVEVAKVLGQSSDVQFVAIGQPVRRLVEAVPLYDPFGGHPDVLTEEPLQGSFAHTDPVHHFVNARDRTVTDYQLD